MQYSTLGYTGIQVSKICLGTMTFGEQNTEQEAHQQLDYAVSQGVNFIDTAEMYPVPPIEKTQGLTEKYIGTWLHKNGKRKELVIASKVSGPGMMPYLRNGPQLTAQQINSALHDSLKRLQTDYLDLYQVHWPARNTNYFGELGYTHQENESAAVIEDVYACLVRAIEQGKVRFIGISNETPWGVMQYQISALKNSWPNIVSVQNPYNLLNRTFEIGLAEISHRENIGLLAYSPLGFGVLTGKYLNGMKPKNARLILFDRFTRYTNQIAEQAIQAYVDLAKRYHCSAAQMALAFLNTRPFLTASIIGATNLDQLKENIESINLQLSEELLNDIEVIHQKFPNPCP